MIVILWVVVLAALALPLLDLATHASFRHLALRNINRRRGEAALVVAGSMFGTAIICSAFVVGATFHASIRDGARTRLGPIDEEVTVNDSGLLPALHRALPLTRLPDADGTLSVVSTTAAVTSDGKTLRAESGRVVAEVDFAAARSFGGDTRATGLAKAGSAPAAGEAVINSDLARALHVKVGSTVSLRAWGGSVPLRVRAVVSQVGVAGWASMFVPPGTLSTLARGAPSAPPPIGTVLVSNRGGVFTGSSLTDPVVSQIRAALGGMTGVSVGTTKHDVLKVADAQGKAVGQLFTLVGLFSVIAGVLLLVNLFVMLAEERKADLGMLRAIGLRRFHLLRVFAMEGTLYALVATLFGAAVGAAMGRVMIEVAKGLFNDSSAPFHLRFSVPGSLLFTGGCIGLAISLVTVFGASARISRLNVIAAIRDLPAPEHQRHPWRGLLAGGIGVVLGGGLTAGGLVAGEPLATLLGPPLICAAAWPLLRSQVSRRWTVHVLAQVALLWALLVFLIAKGAMSGSEIAVFVIQGLILVAAAVTIASHVDHLWLGIVERVARRRASLAARLGTSYPLARTFRTAMLLGMYSLVMFTLTFLGTFAAIYGTQQDRTTRAIRGGTDVVVDANPSSALTATQLLAIPGVSAAAPLWRGGPRFATADHPKPDSWSLTAFDASMLASGQPALTERRGDLADDPAAYRAVLATPGLAIVPSGLLASGPASPQSAHMHPGDTFTMVDPQSGRVTTLKVAGVLAHDNGNIGVMVSTAFARATLGNQVAQTRFLVTAAPGSSPEVVATRIANRLVDRGVSAHTWARIVHDDLAEELQLFQLLEGYLGLGLLIGVAGLGVVMTRAVRDRRREIGMLRAMGVSADVVRHAFLLEAAFIAIQGTAIGVSLGLVTSYQLLANSDTFGAERLPFQPPWSTLIVLCLIPILGSLAATVIPAARAAAIRPSRALRAAD